MRIQSREKLIFKFHSFINSKILRCICIYNSSKSRFRYDSGLSFSSFFFKAIVKEDNFFINVWFSKLSIFNKIRKHRGLSKLVNERFLFRASIFRFSEFVEVKEMLSFNTTDFMCAWSWKKVFIVFHNALHKFEETVSDFEIVNVLLFFLRDVN